MGMVFSVSFFLRSRHVQNSPSSPVDGQLEKVRRVRTLAVVSFCNSRW